MSRPITEYDAWVFARLRAERDPELAIDPDDRRTSDANRELVRRMAVASIEERRNVWFDHLDELPQHELIIWTEAVCAANPDDPAPGGDSRDGGP